jgi:ATP-dependent Lhr-like helicase
VENLVIRQLGASSIFAAKFREAAARALLLPRRRPQGRAPLWQQRKRAYDLLQVASRFGSFPMMLEAYRECLRDVFDVGALVETLKRVRERTTRVVVADTQKPSPFAASLLFRYVANFIYDGDAPLAERRAQALAIDQSQLRDLLGEPELRELLDPDAIANVEMDLQHLDERHKAKSPDALHDLLLRVGDLSETEIAARYLGASAPAVEELSKARRILEISVAREKRWIAVEDASRYRDALGVPLPHGIAERLLEAVADPIGDLVLRYARTHGPFTPGEVARRYGLGIAVIMSALERFVERGRLLEGEFRPGGTQREWCDSEVLRIIRRRSLAKLRHEVEPVEAPAYARLMTSWQGVSRPRAGVEALLEAIESLQGAAMPASIFESEILASRVQDYKPSDLDMLSAAGEIVWAGVEPLGDKDGRIALYLTDHFRLLAPQRPAEGPIVDYLRAHGASFFADIHAAVGGFPNDVVDALWDLVWQGVITNDTFHALRSYTKRSRQTARPQFRSRRTAPATTQGRWSLVPPIATNSTERANALTHQLLARFGVVVREVASVESIAGGFSAVYPVFKAMEEAGRIRRGYFVAGLGATQFASGGAIDLLRSFRDDPEEPETVMLAATDPANPYGALLKWPVQGLMRVVGASVILVNGRMACYVSRGEKQLSMFLPEDEPERSIIGRAVAKKLASIVDEGHRRALLITGINDEPVGRSALAPYLIEAGFRQSAQGYQKRA